MTRCCTEAEGLCADAVRARPVTWTASGHGPTLTDSSGKKSSSTPNTMNGRRGRLGPVESDLSTDAASLDTIHSRVPIVRTCGHVHSIALDERRSFQADIVGTGLIANICSAI